MRTAAITGAVLVFFAVTFVAGYSLGKADWAAAAPPPMEEQLFEAIGVYNDVGALPVNDYLAKGWQIKDVYKRTNVVPGSDLKLDVQVFHLVRLKQTD